MKKSRANLHRGPSCLPQSLMTSSPPWLNSGKPSLFLFPAVPWPSSTCPRPYPHGRAPPFPRPHGRVPPIPNPMPSSSRSMTMLYHRAHPISPPKRHCKFGTRMIGDLEEPKRQRTGGHNILEPEGRGTTESSLPRQMPGRLTGPTQVGNTLIASSATPSYRRVGGWARRAE